MRLSIGSAVGGESAVLSIPMELQTRRGASFIRSQSGFYPPQVDFLN